MSITAIICEFNPFHNGHQKIIQKAKELTPENDILCLMSGNIVERGEIAILEKSMRAKLAILGGADIVLELPQIYASSVAEVFAKGSISILSKIKNVTHLMFGSEIGSIEKLQQAQELTSIEDPNFQVMIKELLSAGNSYPKALSQAINQYHKGIIDESIFTSPNNILGLEYLKYLKYSKSKIIPLTTLRLVDENIFKSATEIRKSVISINTFNNNTQLETANSKAENKTSLNAIKTSTQLPLPQKDFFELKNFMPTCTYDVAKEFSNEEKICETLFALVKYEILTSPQSLYNAMEVTEGIENRIEKAIESATNYTDFIHQIKSKRYTMSKIKRILIATLLHRTKELETQSYSNIDYVKVLAVRRQKKHLLALTSTLNFIVRFSDFDKLHENSKAYLQMDKTADWLFQITNNRTSTKIQHHNLLIV